MGLKYVYTAQVLNLVTNQTSTETGEVTVHPTPTSRSDAEAAVRATVCGRPQRHVVTSVQVQRVGS